MIKKLKIVFYFNKTIVIKFRLNKSFFLSIEQKINKMLNYCLRYQKLWYKNKLYLKF